METEADPQLEVVSVSMGSRLVGSEWWIEGIRRQTGEGFWLATVERA